MKKRYSQRNSAEKGEESRKIGDLSITKMNRSHLKEEEKKNLKKKINGRPIGSIEHKTGFAKGFRSKQGGPIIKGAV